MERTKIKQEIVDMIKSKVGDENVLIISDNYIIYKERRWYYEDGYKLSCFCNLSDPTVPEIVIDCFVGNEYDVKIFPNIHDSSDLGYLEKCAIRMLEAVEVARKIQSLI